MKSWWKPGQKIYISVDRGVCISVLAGNNLQDFRLSLVKRTWKLSLNIAVRAVVPGKRERK